MFTFFYGLTTESNFFWVHAVSSNSLEATYILFKLPYKACYNQHAMKHDIKRLEQLGFSFLKLGHLDAY